MESALKSYGLSQLWILKHNNALDVRRIRRREKMRRSPPTSNLMENSELGWTGRVVAWASSLGMQSSSEFHQRGHFCGLTKRRHEWSACSTCSCLAGRAWEVRCLSPRYTTRWCHVERGIEHFSLFVSFRHEPKTEFLRSARGLNTDDQGEGVGAGFGAARRCWWRFEDRIIWCELALRWEMRNDRCTQRAQEEAAEEALEWVDGEHEALSAERSAN